MTVFVAFIGFLIGAVFFKSYLLAAVEAGTNSDSTFSVMYRQIEAKKDQIFTTICKSSLNLQSCGDAETEIFEGDMPNDLWIALAALLETYQHCSGLSDTALPSFYFTDRTG